MGVQKAGFLLCRSIEAQGAMWVSLRVSRFQRRVSMEAQLKARRWVSRAAASRAAHPLVAGFEEASGSELVGVQEAGLWVSKLMGDGCLAFPRKSGPQPWPVMRPF